MMIMYVCERETKIEDIHMSELLFYIYIFFCLLDNVTASKDSLYY